jgi:hypothetical protein
MIYIPNLTTTVQQIEVDHLISHRTLNSWDDLVGLCAHILEFKQIRRSTILYYKYIVAGFLRDFETKSHMNQGAKFWWLWYAYKSSLLSIMLQIAIYNYYKIYSNSNTAVITLAHLYMY